MRLQYLWAVCGALLALILGCSGSSTTGPSNTGPLININDARIARGHPAIFTVSLSVTSSSPVIFHFATGGGTGVAGTDYVAASGVDTIEAATMSTSISVNTILGNVATGAKPFS